MRGVAPAAILVACVIAPLTYIAASWVTVDPALWAHLYDTQLQRLILNTVWLCAGVALGVTLLGVSLAWLTANCEFPGRRWLDWALMLPLAVPSYVMAFVMLGVLDFGGPLQQLLSELNSGYRPFDPRHPGLIAGIMTLVFYPYVYLLTRSAFLGQAAYLAEASRSLGSSAVTAFLRVSLPVARPAVVAGVALALMETLADFGTVSIFNFDTFTTAIYKSWFGFFDLRTAAQLASLLLLFVFLGLVAERRSRAGAHYTGAGEPGNRHRIVLSRTHGFAAACYACSVFGVAFVLPLVQLGFWVMQAGLMAALDSRFMQLLVNSLLLAAAAVVITVVIAVLSGPMRAANAGGLGSRWWQLANLGYAVPGSVLAVGIMLLFSDLDRLVWLPLSESLHLSAKPLVGGLAALLFAYWIRFFAVATGPVDAGFASINPSIPEAAQLLGSVRLDLAMRVYLPVLRPGILAAALLVFVDVLKEMPATLLLRPYGWDTLAVRIYGLTAEGEWQRAALPALTLLIAGLPAVYIMMKRSVVRT